MINEISYVSDSSSNEGMSLSLGEFDTDLKLLKIWVFQTRMSPVYKKEEMTDRTFVIKGTNTPTFQEYLGRAKSIHFVDLDWDKVWSISVSKFKSKKRDANGHLTFKLSELREL